MAAYDYGDQLTSTATFTDSAGAPADPDAVTFRTRSPAGVETAYVYGVAAAVTRSATGVYALTWVPAAPGIWYVRAEGAGAVRQAAEGPVSIAASAFTGAA